MKIPLENEDVIGRPFIDLTPETTVNLICTIANGWVIAKRHAGVHAEALEVPMTECLREGMRKALKTLPWGKNLLVAPGAESRSAADKLIPDGRTDIPVYAWTIYLEADEHDPHAIIECKRLAEADSHLTREYVTEGVDRFQIGKYGGNHGKGFMVGYILSGTPVGIVAGINQYLGKSMRHAEQLNPSLFPGYGFTWTSQHPRGGVTKEINLHHLMLEVGQPSSIRLENQES